MAVGQKIIVKASSDDRYPVIIKPDRKTIGGLIGNRRRVIIISNPRVFSLHGKYLVEKFLSSGIKHNRVLISDGEQYKNLRTLEGLYSRLLDLKANRDDLIIAFGGGVVGDITGFAAATYMRGVKYVQVPTTLLAMVDSSIGGKVGINHDRGKNLIGNFYHPEMVLINPYWLTTLNRREIVVGFAEIIKTAFLASLKMLKLAVNSKPLFQGKSVNVVENLIVEAVRFKSAIVSKDPRDHQLRHILNFGHTFGHAIEKAENYTRFRHGEAVLAGLTGALYLSHAVGHLPEDRLKEYLDLLAPWMEHLPALKKTPADYLSPMIVDKKTEEGSINFVILERPGKVFIRPVTSKAIVRDAVRNMIDFVNNRGRV